MEGHCSTGQSPQWAVVPTEEEEEEEEERIVRYMIINTYIVLHVKNLLFLSDFNES